MDGVMIEKARVCSPGLGCLPEAEFVTGSFR